MEKINKYVVIYWKNRSPNDYLLEFSEISENCNVKRTIRYYLDKVKVADENGGYLGEWYENTDIGLSVSEFIEDLKSNKEFVLVESFKEEFEKEWLRVISQPGFYIKPYSEYTENDWKGLV